MALAALGACGDDDDGGTAADKIGVGAECTANADCLEGQQCLTKFKGGYCGLENCAADLDCPNGSACVTYEGANYCFRICKDKPDCNRNRPTLPSNCSSSINFVEAKTNVKACLPPSG
jgi:hypothetical protein